MKSAIIDGFRRWKDFSGRSTRAEFWWFQLFVLVWPFFAAITSLLGLLVGFRGLALITTSLLYPILILLIAPPYIAVAIRRMHDVGKSGWFNLIPIYSIYLHLQPAKELGKIPGWIFAERTALVFVCLTIIPVLTDGIGQIGGFVFWGLIYFGIRMRNKKSQQTNNKSL